MKGETYTALAIVGLFLIGSSAAAQTIPGETQSLLRESAKRALPTDLLQRSLTDDRLTGDSRTAIRLVAPPSLSAASHAQIKRGSTAGKRANTLIAGLLGGLAGFYVGGFTSSGLRCHCSPEYFDLKVGAPIGAAVGGALTAAYVYRRQRP